MRVSSRLRASVLGLTLLAGPSLAFGATPFLVRDLNQQPDDPQHAPEQLVSAGDRAVFFLQGDDSFPDHTRLPELWTTDGTASGTERLRSFSGTLLSLGGNGRSAFFAALKADEETWQLWRTDGTAAGTFSFNVTVPDPELAGNETFFYQGRLVFNGCTPQGGCELWASDGTAAGTRQVRDLTPGPASSRPHSFTSAGGRLYFLAEDPTGPALWGSDGTAAGTQRVVTLPPFFLAHDLTSAGGRLFFLQTSSLHDSLWTSDGTAAGTRAVPPFDHAGANRPGIDSLAGSFGGSLLFVGFDRFSGFQLWKTDGTSRGTLRLTSFVPPHGSFPVQGAVLGERFVFQGIDGNLWTTRGTRASTQRLAGCPGGCPLPNLDAEFLVRDGKLFFSGRTPAAGEEPWVTDGTAAGTRALGDLCPGSCGSSPQFVSVLLGHVFFEAGTEIWTTDGTPGGTVLLGSGDGNLAAAGSRIVFASVSESSGPGLAITDGTAAGTQSLDVHFSHGASSDPAFFLPFGNEVRFQTCGGFPSPLWTSDGTAGGTVALAGADVFTLCAPPAKLGNAAFFLIEDPSSHEQNQEVWRGDGTPGGAFPITRLAPDRVALGLGTAGDRLVIFVQEAASGGTELWTSDGTATGTVKVTDLPDQEHKFLAASPGGRPGEFFFQATDSDGFLTFWFSDGTAAGTRQLVEFFLPDLTFTGFTRFNGDVYVATGNAGLWKTDGTAAGTRLILPDVVSNLVPFAGSLFFLDLSAGSLLRSDGSQAGTNFIADLGFDPSFDQPAPQLTAAAGVLYYVAFDADHGSELWRTDGTRAGSRIVADISPGARSSFPDGLTAAGGPLYFTANDGEHGRELWVSDGTAAGTRMVADIAAGPGSSSPLDLTVAGDHLFFSADDGFTGRELWLLPLGPNN